MSEPTPQRSYHAACPNCGADVAFRSAASVSAVCGYCRSTLVRDGESLRRIGQSAELFDDFSPLQLGASGRYLGQRFTLIGRLQLGYAAGSWNEWHALFDGGSGADGGAGSATSPDADPTGTGKHAWLSEDNGAYVFSFEAPLREAPPPAAQLQAGQPCRIDGRAWQVASVTSVRQNAAEGELPHPPVGPQREYLVADLRNEQGEVGTLDEAESGRPVWSVGRSVRLAELQMQGLREASEKKIAGRSIECPNCGASIEPKLESTRSLTCGQCQAVVDISQGVGADLNHYVQSGGSHEPLIALGKIGKLALGGGESLPWQVVGYMERCDLPAPNSDDEQGFWREYLLYHRTEGFSFLVDAEDGWSWMKPLTGAPQQQNQRARWQGDDYQRRWSYEAKTTFVLGEFYWRVQREERAWVEDFDGLGKAREKRLSREQQGQEVVWSGGAVLDAGTLADAFAIRPAERKALQRDAAPVSNLGVKTNWPLMIFLVIAVLMVLMATTCSSDGCDEVRQAFGPSSLEYQQCLNRSRSSSSGGGSWGGFSSSGGGHK